MFDPQSCTTDLCEQIDAGIFSGDLLQTCDINEFKNYVDRWMTAIKEYEKEKENELEG